jgi:hypothetical protein
MTEGDAMGHLTTDDIRTMVAAIANARGNRRGVPAITNILDVLPPKLRDEVIDDAMAVMRAVNAADAAPTVGETSPASLTRSGFA